MVILILLKSILCETVNGISLIIGEAMAIAFIVKWYKK